MNVFNKVTLESLKKNRTRTVVTIIGIILSAAMICAVTTFASSFMNYALEITIYSDGNWHGREVGTDYKTYEDVLNTKDVAETVYLQQLGYAVAEGCKNEYKPYIYLLGAGENVESVLPIHITSGSYPTSLNEILLPKHLYTNGNVKYSIGDTLTLQLGKRMLDGYSMTQNNPCYFLENGKEVLNGETLEVRETRTYTVVGFYERFGWNIEEYTAPGYTAITLADKKPSADYLYDVYFRMKKPKAVYDFMNEKGFSGGRNTDVLLYSGTSQYDSFSTMLYSLSAIIISLIMFGSISLIYNAFSISVSERTKQFGLLSSIGATKKQLRRMVLFEALAVSIVGIPLGIIAGVGGIGVTLMFIGEKFRSLGFPIDMKLSVSPDSIIIAASVALITVMISAWIPSRRATKVSAVEAIRQNLDVNAKGKVVKTSKLTYKLFGLPGILANKYYKRSKKKYRATVLSLFMSIVLFVSASAFTDYLMESAAGALMTDGYDLSFYSEEEDFKKITHDELIDKVKACKSVTDAAYMQSQYVSIQIQHRYLADSALSSIDDWSYQDENSESYAAASAYVTFVNDAAFKALLKEYGLNEQKYMNKERPLGVAVDGNLSFNYKKERYEHINYLKSDSCEFTAKREKNIDGYRVYDRMEDENGNRIVRYVKYDGNDYDEKEYLDLPEKDAYITETLKIGKVIYERPFYLRVSYDGITLIYPISLAGSVLEGYDASNKSYVFLITSSSHAESYTALHEFLAESDFNANNLYDNAEAVESSRSIVTIVQVFSYGFIVLISLIAAANVFNTISTNISLRRREFAMLKSVGMTAKGFNKMMNYECLLYGYKALLMGLPVSCVITYLIYLSVGNGYETNFHLPWGAIGISILSVFLVVFATMMYSMSKIKKDNPIDALKNENL